MTNNINNPPVDKMPEILKNMINAMQECAGGAPISIPFNSIMAATTLALQGNTCVILPYQMTSKPISEIFLTIAKSGERKSTCDTLAIKPIKDWEKKIIVAYEENKKKTMTEAKKTKNAEPEYKPAILINDPTIDSLFI